MRAPTGVLLQRFVDLRDQRLPLFGFAAGQVRRSMVTSPPQEGLRQSIFRENSDLIGEYVDDWRRLL